MQQFNVEYPGKPQHQIILMSNEKTGATRTPVSNPKLKPEL